MLSLSLTLNSRVGCHYPKSGRGMMMALPGVRRRGRNSRIAMRRWNSRMTTMNPLLLPTNSDRRRFVSPVPAVRPSFRYTRDPCANHSSDQVLGTAICTNRRVFSSQCCRSAGEIDSNLVRGTPTGRNGQGKVGWVYFGEGLGHVRLIHSVFLRFMTSPAPNNSIILHSENTMAGGLQNGVYTRFRRIIG